MAAPPGTRFYTYRPGASNVKGQGNQLVLKPGETLGFQTGRGYYAIPGAAPAPVPSSPPPSAPAVTSPAPAPTAPRYNMPDYESIIRGDWGVQGSEAEGARQIGEAETGFQRNLRQAFIDLGASDTSKLGDYAKYIDQATIEAAKANKFSRLAQALKAQTANLRRGRASLAARGMLSSGQTTQDTLDQQQAREASDYGALRDFLGYGEQGMSGLAQVRASIAQQIAAAREAAAQRAAAAYQPTYGDVGPAPDVPAAPGTPAPSTPAPWGGISWGGRTGITTKAQLIAALAPGVSYAQWARNHPDAAARLR